MCHAGAINYELPSSHNLNNNWWFDSIIKDFLSIDAPKSHLNRER